MGDIRDTFTIREVQVAVNRSCTCGGRGFKEEECPACSVWHRLVNRQANRADSLCEKIRADKILSGERAVMENLEKLGL